MKTFMPVPAWEANGFQLATGTEVYTEFNGVKHRGKLIGRTPNDKLVVETLFDNNICEVKAFPPEQVEISISIKPVNETN